MQDGFFKNKLAAVGGFIKRIALIVWKYIKVAKLELIVLVGVFAFDLISKGLVEATLDYGGPDSFVVIIPYFLTIRRTHNYNAAFGAEFLHNLLGDVGARVFFSVFAVAASVAFMLILIRNRGKSKWFRVAIALFIAGAMGNCIDRMFLGYVRDFIEIVYFGLTIGDRTSWYVFNIADAALVSGVIMIVIYFLFMYRDGDKKKDVTLHLDDEEALDQTAEQVEIAEQVETTEQGETAEQMETNEQAETPDADLTAEQGENARALAQSDGAGGGDV